MSGFSFEPLEERVVWAGREEPLGEAAIRIDGRNEAFAERLFTMADDRGELGQLPQMIRLEKRFDFLCWLYICDCTTYS